MSTPSYRTYSASAAESYQRFFEPAIATPVSGPLLEAATLQPGERVLDVACGTGVIARRAAELVGPTGSVAGVDLAPDMIDVAKGLEAVDGAHVEWHVADAASLPIPDAAYDVALCLGASFVYGGLVPTLERLGRIAPLVAVGEPYWRTWPLPPEAEPDEQANPAASSNCSSRLPSTPLKTKEAWLGRRFSASPVSWESGISSSTRPITRSRSGSTCDVRCSRSSFARRSASAKPTI